jgi:hypothetical protein
MDLIKTIHNMKKKVGIKKPEPYLKRLFDLNKGLIENTRGLFIMPIGIVRTTSRTVMNYTNKEWNKTSAHRAKENRHHYREELPRYKQIGRMKALVEMMERGQFKYPVTFKDHNEREVYRSVATALYLEKVYKTNATLMYKIEPRYLEIRAKFSTGEWFAIDWEKMYKSCEFLTENRTVDIPLFTNKESWDFFEDRPRSIEIDRENFEDQSKPHHIKTILSVF